MIDLKSTLLLSIINNALIILCLQSFVNINENNSFTSFLWYLQPKGKTWERYWVAATEQDLFALRAPKVSSWPGL